jgi:hypothetical protein
MAINWKNCKYGSDKATRVFIFLKLASAPMIELQLYSGIFAIRRIVYFRQQSLPDASRLSL